MLGTHPTNAYFSLRGFTTTKNDSVPNNIAGNRKYHSSYGDRTYFGIKYFMSVIRRTQKCERNDPSNSALIRDLYTLANRTQTGYASAYAKNLPRAQYIAISSLLYQNLPPNTRYSTNHNNRNTNTNSIRDFFG